MPAPKIKMYLLPPGYTETGDNDIQRKNADELLPVVPKPSALDDVLTLVGVRPSFKRDCFPFIPASGRVTTNLSVTTIVLPTLPPTTTYRAGGAGGLSLYDRVLIGPSGILAPWVEYTWGQRIDPSNYTFETDGVAPDFHLLAINFGTFHPSGSTRISHWMRTDAPTANWALPADNHYTGNNSDLNKVVIWPSGSTFPTDPPIGRQITPIGPSGSYFTLGGTSDAVRADFWWTDAVSQYFAGASNHWVADHYGMNPDIFVGTHDYPGDQGEVDGIPFVQGAVPKFREIGTYQINYRGGWVKFPEFIDSSVTPVTANYAHYSNLKNVRGITLVLASGTLGKTFRSTNSDLIYPEAYQKNVVNRDGPQFPLTVYVNGQATGRPVTYPGYDTPSVKLS